MLKFILYKLVYVSSSEANCPILSNPPWKGGKAKYRLGLKPINLDEWFDATISSEV